MANKLRNFTIDRVDLVDKGANPKAHIMITKRDATAKPTNDVPLGLGRILRKALRSIASHPDIPKDVRVLAARELEENTVSKKDIEKGLLARLMKSFRKEADAEARKAIHIDTDSDSDSDSDSSSDSSVSKEGESESESESESIGKESESESEDKFPGMLKEMHKALSAKLKAAYADGEADDSAAFPEPVRKLRALHKVVSGHLSAYGAQPGGDSTSESATEGGPDPYGREPKSRNANTKEARMTKRDRKVAKAITAAESRAAKAEKIAKELKASNDLAARKTAVAKAASHLSVDVEKDAAVFQKLAETDPAAYDRVMQIIGGANEAVKKSDLFKEFGTERGGATAGTAWAQIEELAKGRVAKAEGKLTIHKAIDLVMRERPDLVRQHYAEKGQ